jgi:hypothetical protein
MSGTFQSPHTTVRVVGIVRGREIDAPASIALDDDTIVLQWASATPWRLGLDGIDGIALGPTHLTLYLASGDVLDCAGDDSLRAFGTQLVDHACAMPELTRGLRSLGSLRGTPGASHDAWFAPLLSVRRAVEGVSDPLRQLALIDASQLAESMTSVMAQLAAVAAPTDAPTQRSIEAMLEEEAEPVFTALASMAVAGDALRGGALDTRLADWRRWVETVRAVFVAVDEAWTACARVLSTAGR